MTDLPLEIIDHIMTFVDAPHLYELGHVSPVLRLLSKKHLRQTHIRHLSMRLWMHQPGTMAHTPIDFDHQPSSSPASSLDPIVASFSFNSHAIRFDPKKPIYLDGCTIIIHPNSHQASRKHYGITYQQPTLMEGVTSSSWTIKRQGQWSMTGELEQDGLLKPMELTCNGNLFNPDTLDVVLQQQTVRLQQRIQQKKQRGSAVVVGLASSSKESCSTKSRSLLSPVSPTHHEPKVSTPLFT
ncbi:hypothetical protein [Absidia glauca]|uniref:F-box domain-containing protein n=1 Tax=Absidia glauca TaxID=4829 RepID=A0A163JHG4_ABSGL|nr:hypothetical protein [Absidia glauca]